MDTAWILPGWDTACLHLCVQGSVPEKTALRLWWWAENRCAWSTLVLLVPYLKLWPWPDGFWGLLYGDRCGVVVSSDCGVYLTFQHGPFGYAKTSKGWFGSLWKLPESIISPFATYESSLSLLLPLLTSSSSSSALEKPLHWATVWNPLGVVTSS